MHVANTCYGWPVDREGRGGEGRGVGDLKGGEGRRGEARGGEGRGGESRAIQWLYTRIFIDITLVILMGAHTISRPKIACMADDILSSPIRP